MVLFMLIREMFIGVFGFVGIEVVIIVIFGGW